MSVAMAVATPTIACPCCGAPMDSPVPLTALVFAYLTPSERKLLDVLIAHHPAPVSADVQINAIWGLDPNGGPLLARKTLAVFANKINKRLLPLGWQVRGFPGAGSDGGRRLYRVRP